MITFEDLMNRTDDTGQPLTNSQLQAAAIDTFGAAEEITGNTFGVLRDLYVAQMNTFGGDLEFVKSEVAYGEQTYCECYFTEDQIIERKARSKSGKLFLTKLLPPTYINTRNTLLLALENGIDIQDKAKTELEKLNRKAKKAAKASEESEASEQDPREVLEGLLNTASAYAANHGMTVTWSVTDADAI